jgi:hypothetical protein
VQASCIAPRWVAVPFIYTIARWPQRLIASDLDQPDAAFAAAGASPEEGGG